MPRLFPGIDPFLETQGLWPDFHSSMIIYLRDAINEGLPDAYDVRVEERVSLVEYTAEEERRMRPDLLIERSSGFSSADRGTAVLEEIKPITIPVAILEETREPYLEIIRRPERTLVTVVELLSPDNKSGSGFSQYRAKRNSLLHGTVNLVELDLLIGGHRLPMGGLLPPADAYVIVARGDRRPFCEVYAWSVRKSLTKIRMPLQSPDPDIVLDLAAVYATTFEKGRYARSIDYRAPLTIGLAPDDRAWAEALARQTAG